jgi:excisionase family DNA binding protein
VSATATPTTNPSLSTPSLSVGLDAETIDALAFAVARRVAELIPDPAEDGWMDSREAAAYLATSYPTLKERSARGELPAYQDTPGGSLYFKRSELDDWRRSNGSIR